MFQIGSRKLSRTCLPYIIAEISANHCGDITRAKQTIKAAALSGASAIKIQTYTPDTMTIDSSKEDFQIKEGLGKGYSLYQLYQEAHTPFEWHRELFEYANHLGITLFSTPFDESAVDLLTKLNAPAYKIASFELTDLELIKYVSKQGKPLLISTGMGSIEEIAEAVETVKKAGNQQILLFHCVSSYPAATEQSNISNIKFLSKQFGAEVGLSDHTLTDLASTLSIAMGAVAIEKHFKLDNIESGPDASFSLNPGQFASLVENCNNAWRAIGNEGFARAKSEEANKGFRRSLYFVRDIGSGQKITHSDVRRIRPGFGLEPKYYTDIIGKTLKRSVTSGDRVTWDDVY